MPFSDLSDDILLEIAFFIQECRYTWFIFAALDSRCRAAALSAWLQLAIGRKFIIIGDHHPSTVKALREPTKELMHAIRKIHVSSNDLLIGKANKSKFGLNHLKKLIIGSTMLDTLYFSETHPNEEEEEFIYWTTGPREFPLITILNFLASLQPHLGVQRNQIRVLKLWDISYFEDCSDISLVGLAGLEILHIYWQRRLTTKTGQPSVAVCEVLVKMIKAARYTLQSLMIDSSGDNEALRKFDIRMLAGDEGDVGAWKKLRKLRVTIDVDSGSQMSDLVGTMEVIADMFPNLEKLGLITNVWAYDEMVKIRYTPDILKPLSRLTSLHCLKLALDFECDSNDELDEDPSQTWYNRCLHRRYAVTQAIADVCPLTRCYWKHQFENSEADVEEYNFIPYKVYTDHWYRFFIENESGAGKPDDSDSSRRQTGIRVVKTKKSWWMEPHRKFDMGGDLPCEVVGSTEEEYMTSDSDT
ncbi:hypothetical protein K435DRAFT_844514 [Dendrothele bispora CBS 962.96]|uniref:Uncharacterized protein n=1 Tax=Dendrothele bispora (strain CBS 962.96) TaxID=1314807 RepID=A0A4S8L0W9_DENBC|nr:hypothetical protein K435DRAFT_844514 [Dendrothele bispora CBS 962.96]